MEHTYESLSHSTVAQLREIAKEIDHPAVKGYSQMRKEDILKAICEALGVATHAHHEVVGLDKAAIKGMIKSLKAERAAALEAKDAPLLKRIRRRIRRLKRKIRAATV